jgi:hypothetical protein
MAHAIVDYNDDVEAYQPGIAGDFEVAISQVTVTEQRKPFLLADDEPHLVQTGTFSTH